MEEDVNGGLDQETADKVREIARNEYVTDEVEIDDPAELSVGDDGAWVRAWVFVSKHEVPGWEGDDEDE